MRNEPNQAKTAYGNDIRDPGISEAQPAYETLYLCEKPSQARTLAKQLGASEIEDGVYAKGGNIVLNSYGHMLDLALPEHYGLQGPWRLETLPVVPGRWEWTVKDKFVQEYKTISTWLNRVKTVVIATDPDEEGEVIGRQILYELGFRGKILRLWASALDPDSLKVALENPLPLSDTDTAYRAGCVRRKLDWLYGINLSRAFTLASGERTRIGRVTTRLLTELVNREKELSRFVPTEYYAAKAGIKDAVLEWQPAVGSGDILPFPSDGEVAGICVSVKEYEEMLHPPLPLTLSALLADAADTGMELSCAYAAVQELYEAGAISYPRTGSTALPGAGKKGFAPHHAIVPMIQECPMGLSEECHAIFDMVGLNGVMQQYGDATLKVRELEFDMGGEIFTCTDRWLEPGNLRNAGWISCKPDIQDAFERKVKTAKFKPGERVVAKLKVERERTRRPERYTEAELLRHMANIGLGTEATRVGAIVSLVKDKLVGRAVVEPGRSCQLSASEKGMSLIDSLPPSVTGTTMENQMRNTLNHVRSGEEDFTSHLCNAAGWLTTVIDGVRNRRSAGRIGSNNATQS